MTPREKASADLLKAATSLVFESVCDQELVYELQRRGWRIAYKYGDTVVELSRYYGGLQYGTKAHHGRVRRDPTILDTE